MKISTPHYNQVKAAMEACLEYFGRDAMDALIEIRNEKVALWQLYSHTMNQLLYDDSHPLFADGHCPRLAPYDREFIQYPAGINDDHIWTMLKRIGKELGITNKVKAQQ
jgi:hypothetical protein